MTLKPGMLHLKYGPIIFVVSHDDIGLTWIYLRQGQICCLNRETVCFKSCNNSAKRQRISLDLRFVPMGCSVPVLGLYTHTCVDVHVHVFEYIPGIR